jgi:N-acetyl sugar amidotransferase
MKICKKCLNSSTRPNGFINSAGICGVCLVKNKNVVTNGVWQKREQDILEIAKWGKNNSESTYDCIVTVSGGKDSIRQALYVRDELNMNPLLVSVSYPPEQMTEIGASNLENLITLGFDINTYSLNPIIHKELMKTCFEKYSNIFVASEMALYSIPIHAAIASSIKLIFLGDNPAHSVGEKHGGLGSDASQTRMSNTLKSANQDDFIKIASDKDLHFYNYPSELDVDNGGLRVIYLGYYIKDWSSYNNGHYAKKHGMKIRNEPAEYTGDLWGMTGLDDDFRLVNQQIKFLKYGIGYVTDQVMDRIHAGDMSREEGVKLVKQFDGMCNTKYIKKFCAYLEITEEVFWETAGKSRNKDIWVRNGKTWNLKVIY